MRTKLIILFIALLSLSVSGVYAGDTDGYRIEVTNLTRGQPITPPVIALHKKTFQLFSLGEPASAGLGALAKDGVTNTLLAELNADQDVVGTAVGGGLILPGETAFIEFTSDDDVEVSLAAMLARTNDAFIAARNIRLKKIEDKDSKSILLTVYDAGAEENNEQCGFIPAPPCNSPHVDSLTAEGFVHPHPGVYGIAELLPVRDAFAPVGAKITIKKIN
ncbi:MAG: spondin domain-containing protein [Gammaproteobacteria bacterium]